MSLILQSIHFKWTIPALVSIKQEDVKQQGELTC